MSRSRGIETPRPDLRIRIVDDPDLNERLNLMLATKVRDEQELAFVLQSCSDMFALLLDASFVHKSIVMSIALTQLEIFRLAGQVDQKSADRLFRLSASVEKLMSAIGIDAVSLSRRKKSEGAGVIEEILRQPVDLERHRLLRPGKPGEDYESQGSNCKLDGGSLLGLGQGEIDRFLASEEISLPEEAPAETQGMPA